MQRLAPTQIFIGAALAGALVLAGCASTPSGARQAPLHATPEQPDRDDRQAGAPVGQPNDSQMQELLSRLQSLEVDNAQLKKKLSDQYMEAVARKRAEVEAGTATRPAPGDPSNKPAQPLANTGGPHVVEASEPARLSRADLLTALVEKIVEGKDPDRVKALMVAAISVAKPGQEMDHRLLDKLDPKSREQVARFHQMLAVAYDELARDEKAALTRKAMIAKIDKVFGAQPLQIEALQLCRRVDSYGVYEPFATNRFLAGRKNRVLVYVELENFKHEPLDDGRYEVRLEQQVELYDATGETTVWRQGPVQLVDVSRNKRRDFFIVYPIDLPARLPAGAYRLKVRIADKHTGSLCEQTMHDIQIVADQALVGQP